MKVGINNDGRQLWGRRGMSLGLGFRFLEVFWFYGFYAGDRSVA